MARNPRRPLASQVLPHGGLGLGLPVTTALVTRQWTRPARRVVQVVPIDWRTGGPDVIHAASQAPASGPSGDGSGTTTPCEDCT